MIVKTYFINNLLLVLPATRFFSFKSLCLKLVGYSVGKKTSITGQIKFYGHGKFSIGENSWLGIGCRFYISNEVTVTIGDNCDIAPEVKFVTGSHKIGITSRRAGDGFADDIFIGSGSWIGIGSTLLPGVELGEGTLVAAGSVVIPGKYPANALLTGIPAKVKKIFDS